MAEKNHWDVRYRKAKALLGEVEYARVVGQLLPRPQVEALLVDRAVEFKKSLLGRGRRLSLRLAGKSAQECQRILDEDAINILETYSRANEIVKVRHPEAPRRPPARKKKAGTAAKPAEKPRQKRKAVVLKKTKRTPAKKGKRASGRARAKP